MATVLVSFIGIGQRNASEQTLSGYETVEYDFEKLDWIKDRNSIFGVSLLKYLAAQKSIVDKWLVMGTKNSIWFDLINVFENPKEVIEQDKIILNLFEYLKVESTKKNKPFISDIKQNSTDGKDLDTWETKLNENFAKDTRFNNTKIKCRLVGDATDEKSHEKIFQALLEVIGNGDNVIFDVTHGLRNQPIITSFVIMYLRYLKDIKSDNISFYYGAKDLDGEVVKLDFCNKLLKATEAVAIYRQTGNYEQIGEQLNIEEEFNTELKELAFADEMHRVNSKLPNKLISKLEQSHEINPIKTSLSKELRTALDWSSDSSYAKRLKNKAIFYKDRKQYFKAIASLYEAIAVLSCLVIEKRQENNKKLDINDFGDRNYAVNSNNGIKWKLDKLNEDKLNNLQHLRNTILHGTEKTKPQILQAIKNENVFLNIFNEGLNVFEVIFEVKSKS